MEYNHININVEDSVDLEITQGPDINVVVQPLGGANVVIVQAETPALTVEDSLEINVNPTITPEDFTVLVNGDGKNILVDEPGPSPVTVTAIETNLIRICTGVSEGSDAYYMFIQPSASDVWTINHNLNKRPSVTVVNAAEEVVEGDIIYLSNNSVRVTFNAPLSGKAYLN